MKKLLIIPIITISLSATGQDVLDEPKQPSTIKAETFYNRIVEIKPAIPGEEKVLWKLSEDGKATSLYEKKETNWKVKNNMLYIGKKRYHLNESSFEFLEYQDAQ